LKKEPSGSNSPNKKLKTIPDEDKEKKKTIET
jgi:hypothetical protein